MDSAVAGAKINPRSYRHVAWRGHRPGRRSLIVFGTADYGYAIAMIAVTI